MGFLFGGRTGLKQEDLARERERYEPQPLPQNVPDGLVAVAEALNRRWRADRQFPNAPAGSVGRTFDSPLMNAFRPRGGGGLW